MHASAAVRMEDMDRRSRIVQVSPNFMFASVSPVPAKRLKASMVAGPGRRVDIDIFIPDHLDGDGRDHKFNQRGGRFHGVRVPFIQHGVVGLRGAKPHNQRRLRVDGNIGGQFITAARAQRSAEQGEQQGRGKRQAEIRIFFVLFIDNPQCSDII